MNRFAAFATALVVITGTPALAANLLTNGSFETGDFTGYTLSGNTGFTGVSGTFSGVAPTDGSFQAFFGAVGSTGTLSQDVATGAGSYTVSFDLYNFGGTPSSFDASFGANSLLSFTNPGGFEYTHYSFTTTPGAGVSTLAFTIQQNPSYFLLDNLSVTSDVPEPATWALMIGGFAMTGFAARRRRTAVTA